MNSPAWEEFAKLALKRLAASGAEYGDVRIQYSVTETIQGEDRRIASIRNDEDIGFGVRALYHGAWGFAASSILSLEEVPRVADLAVKIAKGSASINLDDAWPPQFSRFERLIEIVTRDETDREKARERFRFYQERGYPLHRVDLDRK